jgi:glutamate formiminotransferase
VLECVVNVSEGRDPAVVAGLAAAAGRFVLDVHTDADHNRSVITLAGPVEPVVGEAAAAEPPVEEAVRDLAAATVAAVDISRHTGAHPRIGALDVVPFVALTWDGTGHLGDGPMAEAVAARDRFAGWAGRTLGLPCFLYGPERSLPEVRRQAWATFQPDEGPPNPHPTAGATAVGARPVLVAYNLWLTGADVDLARRIAAEVRGPGLRTLGLAVGTAVQVSCNLVTPWRLGPGAAFDAVARALEADERDRAGGERSGAAGIERAELVGLLPRAVLEAEPAHRQSELGLHASDTIEARLEQAGLDGGRF